MPLAKTNLTMTVITMVLAVILLLPLTIAYFANVISHALDVFNHRIPQVYLIDLDTYGNLTFMNLVLTSIVNPRKLVVIAHTTSDHLILSDEGSILSILLVIGGYADIVYVNGSYRIGLSKYYARLLGIRVEVIEYYTCYPTTLTYIVESSAYKRLETVKLYAIVEKLGRNDDLKRH